MTRAEQELAEAMRAANGGDFAGAAERFERAAQLLPASRAADAAAAWESVVRLRLMLGEVDAAARALARAQALTPDAPRLLRVTAEVADARGDALERERAWRAVVTDGDPAERVGAWVRLGELARAEGMVGPAVTYFESALAAAPAADLAQRAELELELAMARTAAGDLDGATAALEAAAAHATAEQVTMPARLEGQRGVIALGRGQLEQAMVHAEAARAGAVAGRDVPTYLGAATLIAGIHQDAGRLVEAYDTFMRTQASLGDLLGPDGKALVAPAVQLFEERLGPEQFQRVWDAWVAMRRAARG
ncbi:MAG: hypothetical protein R2939_15255 [Kofleriaceae bacterium]